MKRVLIIVLLLSGMVYGQDLITGKAIVMPQRQAANTTKQRADAYETDQRTIQWFEKSFNDATETANHLRQQNAELIKDYNALVEKHNALIDLYKQKDGQYDKLSAAFNKLNDAVTNYLASVNAYAVPAQTKFSWTNLVSSAIRGGALGIGQPNFGAGYVCATVGDCTAPVAPKSIYCSTINWGYGNGSSTTCHE